MRRHIKPSHTATDSRARIIDAALTTFSRYGYDGTTVRMICDEAGVSPSLINYHWTGKEALWDEICSICYKKINDILYSSADFTLKPEDALPDFINKIFDALTENLDLMRIFMWAILEAESIDYQRTRGAFQPLTDFGKEYLQKLKDSGKIADIDIDISLMMVRAQFILMFSDRHGHLYSFGKDLSDPEHAQRVKASFVKSIQSILGFPPATVAKKRSR